MLHNNTYKVESFNIYIYFSEQMENYIADHCSNNEEFYSKDTFFKFALDSIATSAFGIEIDTFKDPTHSRSATCYYCVLA